jgi:2-isopropylmalate synthase
VTAAPDDHDLIYDWNVAGGPDPLASAPFQILDESLREGIQSPSVVDPAVEEKVELVRLMAAMGVSAVNLGLPGAGPRARDHALALARAIVAERLPIGAACAARTVAADIVPIAELAQRTGLRVEVMAFIGSSPMRQYAEGWDVAHVERLSADALDLCAREGLPVTYVNEDTVRSRPEALRTLFLSAIDHGAHRLCVCDTVGHATPAGVGNVLRFAAGLIAERGATVGLDWHGHNDRGLALANALFALSCGADRVHGTALGLGERVGNPPLELLLLNLRLLDATRRDLGALLGFARAAARAFQVPIPFNYPLAGRDTFRTATGVHAAAILKAEARGDRWMAERVYSAVPASLFGQEQAIALGPLSGESNVVCWLTRRDRAPAPDLVAHLLLLAKQSRRLLTDDEVEAAADAWLAGRARLGAGGSAG